MKRRNTRNRRGRLVGPIVNRRSYLRIEPLESRLLLAGLTFLIEGTEAECRESCLTLPVHPGDLSRINLAEYVSGSKRIIPSGVQASNWLLQPVDTSTTSANQRLGRTIDATGQWIQVPRGYGTMPPDFYFAPEILVPSQSPIHPALLTSQSILVSFTATLTNVATGESRNGVSGKIRIVPVETLNTGASDIAINQDVRRGSVGLEVAKVEQRLRWLGFTSKDGNRLEPADGIFNTNASDDKLESAIKLFQAAIEPSGGGNPLSSSPESVNGVVGSSTLVWLNAVNAPRWVDMTLAPWSFHFPFGEKWGTHWAAEVIRNADLRVPSEPTKPHSNGVSDAYSDSNASHTEHKAGLDIDFELDQNSLLGTAGLGPIQCDTRMTTLQQAEKDVITNVMEAYYASGTFFEKVVIGGVGSQPSYPRIRAALACEGIPASKIVSAKDHDDHFHISLKPPLPMNTISVSNQDQIIEAFNSGIRNFRQSGQISRVVNQAFGVDLPILGETASNLSSAADRFSIPFSNELSKQGNGEGEWQGNVASIAAQLAALGFDVHYVGLTADASGDLLRATFRQTWNLEQKPASFGLKSGFDYFDSGTSDGLTGTLTARVLPVTLTLTLGVDLTEGEPRFFVSEDSSLVLSGIEIQGNVQANMAIRNLLDVDVIGTVTGSLGGALTFADYDLDGRLRAPQFATPSSIVRGGINGRLDLIPTLKGRLPILGTIEWSGSWSASIVNGSVDVSNFRLNPPSVDVVEKLLKAGYEVVAKAFKLFGDVDLNQKLPAVDKGIGEVLGLPSFLTGGKLGLGGVEVKVTPQSILDLINGKTVDLIRFESSGGDRYSTRFSVPIVAGVIPLGPIPVTASISMFTELSAGWRYHVGLGVDTSGFYIDPGTSFSGFGEIRGGISASVSVLGIAGMSVNGGVGASLEIAASFRDPDPRDGRIYLDELLSRNEPLGRALIDAIGISASGEIFGFVRGVASFLFWDWEVFNERFTIASFNSQLIGSEKEPRDNPSSQRKTTNRSPLGTGVISDSVLQDGVLTIDTRSGDAATRSNAVSISRSGTQVEIIWRGIGSRIYDPGLIRKIVLIGNESDDRFYVGDGIEVPVEAYGNGGNDLIQVVSAPTKILGGDGNDILRGGTKPVEIEGGSGDDQIYGGDSDDRLSGEDGDDRIEGGAGHDRIDGNDGNDILIGGLDDDVLNGGSQSDTLFGGQGNDALDGGDFGDVLYGEQGDDILYGGNGEDYLIGGVGGDTIYGGNDNDTIFGDRGYAEATVGLADGNDFLYGQEGDDRLYGEGGNDRIEGDDADQNGDDILVGDGGLDDLFGGPGLDRLLGGSDRDNLYGGTGNDILNGGEGADVINGDDGDDTIQIDFASASGNLKDDIRGGRGKDQLAVVGTVKRTVVDGVENVDSNIDDFIRITHLGGNNFQAENLDPKTAVVLQTVVFSMDMSLTGDLETLSIQGLGGNDQLVIGADQGVVSQYEGRDFVLYGDDGNDLLIGGQGRDALYGGNGDDKLIGGPNQDRLFGGPGRDELIGDSELASADGDSDFLDAGEGDDIIRGGKERGELIRGGKGNDTLIAGNGFWGTEIEGGPGDDLIVGGPGQDILKGESGDDIILGGGMDDLIDGGQGNDVLVGELGRDVIDGGDGDDTLYAYLNNAIRSQLGLPIVGEPNAEERASRRKQLQDIINNLEAEAERIERIPPSERSENDRRLLLAIPDLLVDYQNWRIDLDDKQARNIDRLNGGIGNDKLYGSPFSDILNGREGSDAYFAGHGDTSRFFNDVLENFDNESGTDEDTIWYDASNQSDRIRVMFTTNQAGNPSFRIEGLEGLNDPISYPTIEIIGIRTHDGDDEVTADFGTLEFKGLAVDAGSGDDRVDATKVSTKVSLWGGPGNDDLRGGSSFNQIFGEVGDDQLVGGDGQDLLDGGVGDDLLLGGDGQNRLFGGPGNDQIFGGIDNDQGFGGDGNDNLSVNGGQNRVLDGNGMNQVLTNGGTTSLVVTNAPYQNFGTGTIEYSNLIAPGFETKLLAGDGGELRGSESVLGVHPLPFGRTIVIFHKRGSGTDFVSAQMFSADGRALSPRASLFSLPGQNFPWLLTQTVLPNGNLRMIFQYSSIAFGFGRYEVFAIDMDLDLNEVSPIKTIAHPNPHFLGAKWYSPYVSLDTNGHVHLGEVDDSGFVIYSIEIDLQWNYRTTFARGFGNFYTSPRFLLDSNGGMVLLKDELSGSSGFQDGNNRSITVRKLDWTGSQVGTDSYLVYDQPIGDYELINKGDDGFVLFWSKVEQLDEFGYDFRSSILRQNLTIDGQPIGTGVSIYEMSGRIDSFNVFQNSAGDYLVNWNGDSMLFDKSDIVRIAKFPTGWIGSMNDFGFVSVIQTYPDQTYSLYRSDAAPPTVARIEVATRDTEYSFVFSELMSRSGISSVTNAALWAIEQNGTILPDIVTSVDATIVEVDRLRVTLKFNRPLHAGEYRIIAKAQMKDLAGRDLDGNGDGVGGDDFTYRFTVTGDPLKIDNVSIVNLASASSNLFAMGQIDVNTLAVAWIEADVGGAGVGVFVQRWTKVGVPLGPKVRVNSFAISAATSIQLEIDANGGFLIVWNATLGTSHFAFGRGFHASGLPVTTSEWKLDENASQVPTNPRVSLNQISGGYFATWLSRSTGVTTISLRRFGLDGSTLGAVTTVVAGSASTLLDRPSVASNATGSQVIVWSEHTPTGRAVRGRWYSSTGVDFIDFTVSETLGNEPSLKPTVSMNAIGAFVVGWIVGGRLLTSIFSRPVMGSPLNGRLVEIVDGNFAYATSVQIAQNNTDGFGVAWNERFGISTTRSAIRWYDYSSHRLSSVYRFEEHTGLEIEPWILVNSQRDYVLMRNLPLGTGQTSLDVSWFTTSAPTILSTRVDLTTNTFIIEFSQDMARTGPGSVLSPSNWALRLPDGRYLWHSTEGFESVASQEQFGSLEATLFASGRMELRIQTEFKLNEGAYVLVPKSTIEDISGRRLASRVPYQFSFDAVPPTATISVELAKPGYSLGKVTIEFDEDVEGLELEDFKLTRNGSPVGTTAFYGLNFHRISGRKYEIEYSVLILDGLYTLTLPGLASGVKDLKGNQLTKDSVASFVVDHSPRVISTELTRVFSDGPVKSIVVTFDSSITYDSTAFRLWNDYGEEVIVNPQVVVESGFAKATLEFSGSLVAASGGLVGGNYTLVIGSERVRDLSEQTMDDSYSIDFSSVNNQYPWHNAANPLDVDNDKSVSPLDVLALVNYINMFGPGRLAPPNQSSSPPPFLDPDADGDISPLDVLMVINHINLLGSGEGESHEHLEYLHPSITYIVIPEIIWGYVVDSYKKERRKILGSAD